MIDSNGTALVTGASSGIGAATVRALRADGRAVVALARRADRLEALAEETGCTTLALDLRDADAIRSAVREVRPAVLVNNAGTGHGIAGLHTVGTEDVATTLATNVAAPVHLVRAAVPIMREAGGGHIVNIGSIAGLYPIVSALYGATKGAMHLFTQNLRVELRGSGIRVTEVAPGRTESEFYDAAALDEGTRGRMTNTGIQELKPEDVAAAILYALAAPPHVNVGLIEMTPTEQALGGAHLTPYEGAS